MKQIFLVQQSFIEKDSFSNPVWSNLYCVSSESEAINDCKRMQEESDTRYSHSSFHFVYNYQKLDLF